jgi:chromate reductase
MNDPVRLLVTAGSSRAGSYNGRLADIAAGLAREAGAQVTRLDLHALDLPVFHAAIEAAGLPAGAFALRDAFAAHDAVFIASPEYNGFPTPLLINSFAWASRVPGADGQLAGLAAMAGKPAGLVSASPGLLGGLRSLNSFRAFLQMAPAMVVVPEQFALSQAGKAFDDAGALLDEKHRQAVQRVVRATLRMAAALRDAPKG